MNTAQDATALARFSEIKALALNMKPDEVPVSLARIVRICIDAGSAPPDRRNWTEDASHENGNYECRCIECDQSFIGHKRRVLCKACSGLLTPSASAGPQAEAVGWTVRFGNERCFYWEKHVAEWKAGEFEDKYNLPTTISPVYAHPQPQQTDGRGAVIEALKPLARLYNLIDHEDAEPDSTMFFQHDACTIEYGDIRTARNLIAALQQPPATDNAPAVDAIMASEGLTISRGGR